jgi:hypothetical protein
MADRDRPDVRAQDDAAARTSRRTMPFRWLTGRRSRLRYTLLVTLACMLPLVPLTILAANPFTDLNNGSIHNADIDTVYNLGIANGTSPTTFEPNANVTREQMASFLARTAAYNRIGFATFTSAGTDANIGDATTKDYMTVNLTVPGREGQPVYVRVNFTGYVFARSSDAGQSNAGCPCLLRGELRMDDGGKQIVTRSVVGANANDYVGTVGAGGVADADRKDFSGSTVFLATPGQHTFTMSITREIGSAQDVGFAFGNMQAEVIGFGGSGTLNSTMLTAALNGANEVNNQGEPNQGDPDGTGTAMISLNPAAGEVCYTINVANISPATAAHIHDGPAGVNGPVVVNFAPPSSGTITGCTSADPALVQDIADNPAEYYVNVHNGDFPPGAVRGQLGQ